MIATFCFRNFPQANAMFFSQKLISFTERMHALVPNEKVSLQTKQILTRPQPFEMFYTLNCQNLCSDFQEDLEFRFSWGITAMIQRFTGKAKTNTKGAILNHHNSSSNVSKNRQNSRLMWHTESFILLPLQVPKLLSPMANEPNSPMCLMPQSGITPEQLSLISRFAVASIGSQGTVGGLLVGGLVSD